MRSSVPASNFFGADKGSIADSAFRPVQNQALWIIEHDQNNEQLF